MRRVLRVERNGSLTIPKPALESAGFLPGDLILLDIKQGEITVSALRVTRPRLVLGRPLEVEEIGEFIVAGARE